MSLKDQMVKAGLVSAKQARQAAHAERVGRKTSGAEEADHAARERAEEVRRGQEAARERDRVLNQQRLAGQVEKEHEAQERDRRLATIAAALREGKVEHWGGSRAYYFADGTRIERLDVSDDAQRRLQEGRAAIVRTGNPQAPYALLHTAQALRLRDAEPALVVTLHGA